ncbi:DNA-binding protein [Dorea formicigenerans]|uniref:DNA-binding protein n=1 Tax=Dorea formicigenerans TaxID=39486 RepID=UPI001C024C60|nr:DNA-binding protein [Dorea formicigenerans]
MQNKLFLKDLNKELEEQGYLTLRGKVPTKYFVKRFYGVEDTCEIPQEEGKEWFHA